MGKISPNLMKNRSQMDFSREGQAHHQLIQSLTSINSLLSGDTLWKIIRGNCFTTWMPEIAHNSWNYRWHIIIQTTQRQRALKAAREKWFITYKESLKRVTADFSSETGWHQKIVGWHIQSAEWKRLPTKNSISSKKSSKKSEKFWRSQINKNRENLLLTLLFCKN